MNLIGVSCIFPVPNIKKTSDFYINKLGFKAVEYLECKEPHICLYRDKVEIILLNANKKKILPNRELYGYGYDAYIYTTRQEFIEKELINKNVKIIRPLHTVYELSDTIFLVEPTPTFFLYAFLSRS